MTDRPWMASRFACTRPVPVCASLFADSALAAAAWAFRATSWTAMLIWCTAVATMVWSPWDVATWLTWLLMALISSEVTVSFLAVSARWRSSACWLSSIILKARAVSGHFVAPRASARA